jgi:hypothetical protein
VEWKDAVYDANYNLGVRIYKPRRGQSDDDEEKKKKKKLQRSFPTYSCASRAYPVHKFVGDSDFSAYRSSLIFG